MTVSAAVRFRPGAARLQADEEQRHLARPGTGGLGVRAVLRVAGQQHVGKAEAARKLGLDQRQHRGELREQQDAPPVLQHRAAAAPAGGRAWPSAALAALRAVSSFTRRGSQHACRSLSRASRMMMPDFADAPASRHRGCFTFACIARRMPSYSARCPAAMSTTCSAISVFGGQVGGHLLLRAAQQERRHPAALAFRPGARYCPPSRWACGNGARSAFCRAPGTPAAGSRTTTTARPDGSRAACPTGTGAAGRCSARASFEVVACGFLMVCASSSTTTCHSCACQHLRGRGRAAGRW